MSARVLRQSGLGVGRLSVGDLVRTPDGRSGRIEWISESGRTAGVRFADRGDHTQISVRQLTRTSEEQVGMFSTTQSVYCH